MVIHYGRNGSIGNLCLCVFCLSGITDISTIFEAISKLEAERETPIFEILEHFRRDNKHIIIIKNEIEEIGKLDESEVLHACFTSKLAYRPIGELLYPY